MTSTTTAPINADLYEIADTNLEQARNANGMHAACAGLHFAQTYLGGLHGAAPVSYYALANHVSSSMLALNWSGLDVSAALTHVRAAYDSAR